MIAITDMSPDHAGTRHDTIPTALDLPLDLC
jgi:hypothetical protein